MQTLVNVNPLNNKLYYAAGGNGKPILTRASNSKVNGFQTFGLPGADTPKPGGGANKTVLGAYRMGDQDGITPGSAIYANDIFSPLKDPLRKYQAILFPATGNNVFQPDSGDKPTQALLERMAFTAEKAKDNEPFADYFAQLKLSKDVDLAGRSSGIGDLIKSREIIRHVVDMRREQNNSDYLRRMLDAGLSAEDAQKEIDNVKKANALQEAKKIEDRPYQSKLLIARIAQKRGLTSMINEPLTSSGAISSPQPNGVMSAMIGKPGQGFGESPLDLNRVFMTPDFYKSMLRRTTMTEESAQEQSAMATLLAQGDGLNNDINEMTKQYSKGFYDLTGGTAVNSGISANTFNVMRKQEAIENRKESLLANLDNLRMRQEKRKIPLPQIVIAPRILGELYGVSKPTNMVETSAEIIETLDATHLFLSMNVSIVTRKVPIQTVKSLIQNKMNLIGIRQRPLPTIVQALREIARQLNDDNPNMRIPFARRTNVKPKPELIADELFNILGEGTDFNTTINSAHNVFVSGLQAMEASDYETLPEFNSRAELSVNNPIDSAQASFNRSHGSTRRRERSLSPQITGRTAVPAPVGDSGGAVLVNEPTLQQRVDFSRTNPIPDYIDRQSSLPIPQTQKAEMTGINRQITIDAHSAGPLPVLNYTERLPLHNQLKKYLGPISENKVPRVMSSTDALVNAFMNKSSNRRIDRLRRLEKINQYNDRGSVISTLGSRRGSVISTRGSVGSTRGSVISSSLGSRRGSVASVAPAPAPKKSAPAADWKAWCEANGIPYTTLKEISETYG